MMKRDTNIDELFKGSKVNEMINQQEFLNKLSLIGYNLAANKLKVKSIESFSLSVVKSFSAKNNKNIQLLF